MIGALRTALFPIVLATAFVSGCIDEEEPASAELILDTDPACSGIDICRPCDPHDFDIGPDGTNRCGFVLRYREVAKMGTEPIAYQGSHTTSTWTVVGANPDGSAIFQTSQLSGANAFTAIHGIAGWDDYFRDYDTDPPIGEWAFARSRDDEYTRPPTTDVIATASGTGDLPPLPVVRCGDQSMTVEITWPYEDQGTIRNCDCDRILRETARRYAAYHHLDRHVIQVSSFAYSPSQYLVDDYAGTSPRGSERAAPRRRVIRTTDGPNTPAITQASNVYTITLHSEHPQTVKSDAKVFKADTAIKTFKAYEANRQSMVRLRNFYVQHAAAQRDKDTKGRIIQKIDTDVVIGSGPIAGVLASHLPEGTYVIDDGEKRHLHRNNTRIIQHKDDVTWARNLGPEKPDDFVEARQIVGDGPLRHVHVGMAAEQLFKGKKMVPGKITKIESVDGEVHLEMKVDGIEETFVLHVSKTKRVWVVTGPPETEAATYNADTTAPSNDAAKLALHDLGTPEKVKAFIAKKIHTNNEWYDLPHPVIRERVHGKHVFVFGSGGGALQAIGQITDGNGGEGEVAGAKKVTVATFNGGVKVASFDPATQPPNGGQQNAFKALKKLAGIADGDDTWTVTQPNNVIYGHPEPGKEQGEIVIDKVAVVFHDPGDGNGERPMLKITIKRPKLDKSPGLDDKVVFADEAIWSIVGPGKTDLGLDASVVKSFKLAMDGEVPLGAQAVDGRVRFVAANATTGMITALKDVKDVTPDAGTIAELKDAYQAALTAMRKKAVNGQLVDINSQNEGTLLNQMRYVPLFTQWSPP